MNIDILIYAAHNNVIKFSCTIITDWIWVILCVSGSVGLFFAPPYKPNRVQVAVLLSLVDEVGVMFSLNLWNARIADQCHSAQCHLCSFRLPDWVKRRSSFRKSSVKLVYSVWMNTCLFVFSYKSSLPFVRNWTFKASLRAPVCIMVFTVLQLYWILYV